MQTSQPETSSIESPTSLYTVTIGDRVCGTFPLKQFADLFVWAMEAVLEIRGEVVSEAQVQDQYDAERIGE